MIKIRSSISVKIIALVVIVVVICISGSGIIQSNLVSEQLHNLAMKHYQAEAEILISKSEGAIKWKKQDLILKAFEDKFADPGSALVDFLVLDSKGEVM